jgi:hypothetical protein
MFYHERELVDECQVSIEFFNRLKNEGGGFEPSATVTVLGEKPIEIYDTYHALMLMWVKAFVKHGWDFYHARNAAEEIIAGYYEDAEKERFPFDDVPPPDRCE